MSYDTALGRWLKQDPGGYVDHANLYQFDDSGPNNRNDPAGLAPTTQPSPTPIVGPPTIVRDGGDPIKLGGPNFTGTFLDGALWGDTQRTTTDGLIHTKLTPLALPDSKCIREHPAELQHDIDMFNFLAQLHEEENQDRLKRYSVGLRAPGTGLNDPEEARLLYNLYSRLRDIMSKCDCSDVNSPQNLRLLRQRLYFWQQQAFLHPLPPPFTPVPMPPPLP